MTTLNKEVLIKGGYVVVLHRSRTIYIHEVLDSLCKEAKPGKSLAKQRKAIASYAKEAGLFDFSFFIQKKKQTLIHLKIHFCFICFFFLKIKQHI